MKTLNAILSICLLFVCPALFSQHQKPIIINHKSVDLSKILNNNYISKAKYNLNIGYGHTSHGSQLITGMNALMSYFEDGRFNWSSEGGPGYLKIEEDGTLYGDCGEPGWDDLTRDYLQNNPKCNVIIWSWCGQVNDVDLNSHYLSKMNQLEKDYPKVKFVYMTGHLEGEGPNGSLERANNHIRQFCINNNKILYDFADIEKYDPDGTVNYDEFFADDGCNYQKPGGEYGNWAIEWLQSHPDHILAKICELVSECAHSESLNCVMKGIASWHLWAKLVGWEDNETFVESDNKENQLFMYPNPASEFIEISKNHFLNYNDDSRQIKIHNILGQCLIVHEVPISRCEQPIKIDISTLTSGVYYLTIDNIGQLFVKK
ncbi:MAG: T9SS type A sorting domain-containing protein [Candidatus Kapabacteria bacterium]|nr:T9SS type A sorting domain-containing protein [Candidatus Kapabacteria bacterium]